MNYVEIAAICFIISFAISMVAMMAVLISYGVKFYTLYTLQKKLKKAMEDEKQEHDEKFKGQNLFNEEDGKD